MTTETQTTKSITFAVVAALAIGAPLAGGTFVGVVTLPNGTHAAVALLPDKPAERLNWKDAKKWAESVDGELPSRPVAAMLFANAKGEFESEWHWTNETCSWAESYAWICYFYSGSQSYDHKGITCAARAVRLIHLEG